MELPDFDSPKSGPEKPPEVAVVGVGQPSAASPVAPGADVPAWRRWMVLGLLIVGPLCVLYSIKLLLAETKPPPAVEIPKPPDPAVTKDGQALVIQRERTLTIEKYTEVRALVASSRKANGGTRDIKNLEFSLAQVDGLIRMGAFEQANISLDKIKAAVPGAPVNNALDSAPKPIDVKAPPKVTNEDPTPKAPASAQRRGTVNPATSPTPPPAAAAPVRKKKPVKKRRR